MIVQALVWKEEHNKWPARNGKPGGESFDLVLMDDTNPPEHALSKPIRHRLSEEEKAKHWGSLNRKPVKIGITEIMVQNGMPIARGSLIFESPKK